MNESLVTSVNSAIGSAKTKIEQLYDVNAELIHEYIELAESKFESLKALKEDIESRLEDPELTEDERLSMLMNYNKNQVEIDKIRQKLIVLSAESNAVSARAVWHSLISAQVPSASATFTAATRFPSIRTPYASAPNHTSTPRRPSSCRYHSPLARQ